MIRKLIRIVAGSQSRRHRPEAVRGRLKLRPRMMELEGRTLLSTFTVNSTADDGSAGTLRWAIAKANASRHADTIVFGSLFNTPQTITLTRGQLTFSDRATTRINGPGENLLTINGNNASRVFNIKPGSAASLSGLTITGGSVNGNGGGVKNDGGRLALHDVIVSGNSAGVGGGLFNSGTTTLADVVISGNTARVGARLFSSRVATLTWRTSSSPAPAGQILFDGFNGTGGVPKNWVQIPGTSGPITEKPGNLTITDTTGNTTGILSNLPSPPFSPVKVMTTTIQANLKSVGTKPVGNAIVGLIGVPNSNGPTGELAAGIDSTGVVFVVAQQQTPQISQTIVPLGKLAKYNGGPITLTLTINSSGVVVTAGAFSGQISFSKDLPKFSLTAAFANGAIPALVAASQQGQKGGSASFASIKVTTT
jgi:hypothetical protein